MMHHFPLAIALEIIAITLALFLLAKTKTELMGRWFRWGAYILVIGGWLAMACTVTHGICGLICCARGGCEMGGGCGPHEGEDMEACGPGEHHGMKGACCREHGGKGGCGMHGEGKGMRSEHEGFEDEHEEMEHEHMKDSLQK